MDAKEQCAKDLLETVPGVMRYIREKIRVSRLGVTLPQFRTLTFASRTADASLSDAAEMLGLSKPAMSRLADGLVRSGLLTRSAVADNRRQVALAITPEGSAKLEQVRALVRSELTQSLDGLSAEELQTISRATELMRRSFSVGCPRTTKNHSENRRRR